MDSHATIHILGGWLHPKMDVYPDRETGRPSPLPMEPRAYLPTRRNVFAKTR